MVICVGYDLVEYHPQGWNPGRDKKVIHIDRSPAEVDAHYIVSVGIESNIGLALDELGAEVGSRGNRHYTTALREGILSELEDLADDKSVPMKPQRILSDVRKVLGAHDILISDVGAHKLWIARMYPCLEPNTCLISNGFASMGIALPGAIGAKLLYPDRKVLAISGDGGFLMNCQELETAVREKANVVNLVLRDDTYGLIRWKQTLNFGRTSYVDFGNPDFAALGKSFGCEGYRVEAADELERALRQAIACNRPAVIDCPVDYQENLALTERLGQFVCPM